MSRRARATQDAGPKPASGAAAAAVLHESHHPFVKDKKSKNMMQALTGAETQLLNELAQLEAVEKTLVADAEAIAKLLAEAESGGVDAAANAATQKKP